MTETIEIRACRACLETKGRDLENIFSNGLAEKFQFCFDINVNNMIYAPTFLCKECVVVIINFTEYKQKCLKADAFWKSTCKSVIENSNANVEIDMKKPQLPVEEANSNIDDIDYTMPIKDFKDEKSDDDYFDNDDCAEAGESVLNTEDLVTSPDVPLDQPSIKDEKIKYNFRKKKAPTFESVNGKRTLRKFAGRCQGCKRVFSYKKSLISHLQNCVTHKHKIKTSNSVTNEEDLDKKQKVENGNKYCGLCEMTTSSESILFAHLNEHEQAGTLACSRCDFEAIDLADYMAHRLKHQPGDYKEQTYKCHKNCKKRYRVPSNYEFHYRKVHLKKTPGLCKLCDKTYLHLKTWKFHLESHFKPPAYECDTCGRGFYVRHQFIQHLQTHNDRKDEMCDLCGFSTKRRSFLRTHMRLAHEVTPKVTCEICGKKYKNEYGIKSHMLLSHREKKFTCEVCGKRFPSLAILRDHEIWHSDIRPFKCTLCTKAYKIKNHLVQHLETHTTVKAFMCDICLKCFTTSRLLGLHRRRNKHFKIKEDILV